MWSTCTSTMTYNRFNILILVKMFVLVTGLHVTLINIPCTLDSAHTRVITA